MTVIVHGKWLDNLKKEMSSTDFCFLCLHHLSHGHHVDCPMITDTGNVRPFLTGSTKPVRLVR